MFWMVPQPFPGTSLDSIWFYNFLWSLKSWVIEWGWKFPLDASVVMVDIFLISGLVDEDYRLFTMLRLLRAAKFRKAPWWKGKILEFFTSLSQTKWCHNFFLHNCLSPRSWACLRIAWRHRVIWSWCTGPSFFKLSHRSWWWTTAWYHPQLGSLVAELSHASHAHELRLVGFFMWAVWASSLATCQNAKKCLNDDLRCTDITRHKKNSGIPNWIETYLVLERTGFMQYMFLGKKSRFQLQRTPVQV